MKKILIFCLLYYLRFFARVKLFFWRPVVIGITGTAGKTSTKNALYAVLKDDFRVKVSQKANSETGIPLDILDLHLKDYNFFSWLKVLLMLPLQLFFSDYSAKYYVVEMAIDGPDKPKNMEYLLTIIKPQIAIFLNVRCLHSYAFDYLITESNPQLRRKIMQEKIAMEKGKLITSLKATGMAILNFDDQNVIKFKNKTKASVLSFGFAEGSDILVTKVSHKDKQTSFSFKYDQTAEMVTIPQALLPDYYAYSFAACLAVALKLGLSLKKACHQLSKNYHLPRSRSSLLAGVNNSLILDSSYNASVDATLGLIKLIKKLKKSRNLVLLGDHRELGALTEIEHIRLARALLSDIDQVYLVGPLMKQYVLPFLEKNQLKVTWYQNASLAADAIKKELKAHDILLVKGSQNTLFLEMAVAKLLSNKADLDKLCRQNEFWEKKRQEILRA